MLRIHCSFLSFLRVLTGIFESRNAIIDRTVFQKIGQLLLFMQASFYSFFSRCLAFDRRSLAVSLFFWLLTRW